MKERFKSAFSLMEMMIVLLIVAIVAAATAPMVTKKMTRAAIQGASSGGGLWIDVSDAQKGKGIAFNLKGDKGTSVLIGTADVPIAEVKPKFVIKTTGSEAPIAFTTDDKNYMNLIIDNRNFNDGGQRVGISNAEIPKGSVAIGLNQSIGKYSDRDVIIGYGTEVNGSSNLGSYNVTIGLGAKNNDVGEGPIAIGQASHNVNGSNGSIAIGHNAKNGEIDNKNGNSSGKHGIALGYSASNGKPTSNEYGIAIGFYSNTSGGDYAIAIGQGAHASGKYGLAIGDQAKANHQNAIVIAHDVSSSHEEDILIGTNTTASQPGEINIGNTFSATSGPNRRITLGDATDTVHIPGNLVVDGNVILGKNGTSRVYANVSDGDGGNGIARLGSIDDRVTTYQITNENTAPTNDQLNEMLSDRRLKNVGEKFTSGLAELKKLDLYHFTYKKDKDKTPHIGVIAQDLQKVFPDAVTKGDDGYLRIRLEDMFYAMINAIREIDNKIESMIADFKSNREEVAQLKTSYENQQKVIEAQQATIEAQQKSINELVTRLDKLEKKQKKEEK